MVGHIVWAGEVMEWRHFAKDPIAVLPIGDGRIGEEATDSVACCGKIVITISSYQTNFAR